MTVVDNYVKSCLSLVVNGNNTDLRTIIDTAELSQKNFEELKYSADY
jgi:hypothetical protein